MEYSEYQHLKVKVEDHVAVVTINRPENLNAINKQLHHEIAKIWADLDTDPDVRVAVVIGAGDRAFSAGGDLREAEAREELSGEDHFVGIMEELKMGSELVYSIVNCSKPIISAINGVAVGGGLAVGLLADISLIAEDARLTDGHMRLGLAAGDHACMIWPMLCGLARAKYYLLTCEFIDGREAERIGLVSKCVPRKELMPTAMRIARQLADGPQHALRLTKRAINQWLRVGGIISFDYSLALELLNFYSDDLGSGLRAIREKKTPVFPSASRRG